MHRSFSKLQQERRGFETAHGRRLHRRRSSGSTDSSLASLPNSPAFKLRFPNMVTAQEEEDTDSWYSSILSFVRREPPREPPREPAAAVPAEPESFPSREADSIPVEPESFTRREPDSFLRPGFEETESPPSSVPVSPSEVVKGRIFSFVGTPPRQPEATKSPRRVPYMDEHGRLPDTWQGVVQAAAREDRVRMTRSSSMPDAATLSRNGRSPGRRAACSGTSKSPGRATGQRLFSSTGGGGVGGGNWDGVAVSGAEHTLGSAYHELFANRGRSPGAVRRAPRAKARPSRAKEVRFSADAELS